MDNFFLRTLKLVVNAVWYLLLLLMAIVAAVMVYKLWTTHYLDWEIPVKLKAMANTPALQSTGERYAFSGIKEGEAVLQFKVRPNAGMLVMVIISFAAAMFLLFGILYQFRKILNSLKVGVPFIYQNIRRLRLISLFLFLMAMSKIWDGFSNRLFLSQHFPGADALYQAKIEAFWWPVLASLIVLVLSEVFRYGHQLKTDNESFI